MADALDSGSSEGNFMQVQVLLPAPKRKTRLKKSVFSFFMKRSLREHEDTHANEAAFGYEECLRHIKERFASCERKRVLHLIP